MFRIQLKTKRPLIEINPKYDIKEYDDELDDGRSIIEDICEAFRDSEEILLVISGFGEESWPVDCLYDLPIIIEQLPEILRRISKNNYNFELDFYEQGIEREIQFKDNGSYVSVICISRTDWKPFPDKIDMLQEDIKNMFVNLYTSFISYGEALCFKLINHPMLKEWMEL